MKLKSRKGQSLNEYALLIGIITAAILSMNWFLQARTQAVLFDSVAQFGDPFFADPYNPSNGMGSIYSQKSNRIIGSDKVLSYSGGVNSRNINKIEATSGNLVREDIIRQIED